MALPFPANPIGILVEILINGTWTDITSYVFSRDVISITRGRPNEASQIQPASMTLTLNNQDGSFSPKNTSGQFYPYLTRNTQLRLSLNTQSSQSVAYSGYRFWGEVSTWPPQWDNTGTDVFVQIQVDGILRRYQQGKKLGSALRRFYMLKTDATTPIAYWPCEEGSGATTFANLMIPADTLSWSGTPQLSSDSNFQGSDPIPLLNNSSWTGTTGSYAAAGPKIYSTPGTYTFTGPGNTTSLTSAECWGAGGGGANGYQNDSNTGGGGGAGGEYAKETSVAIVPGGQYTVVVGSGGAGGAFSASAKAGGNGGNSSFAAAAVTVTAHGGGGGSGRVGGTGGTGSSNTTHNNGGSGGSHTGTGNTNAGGAGGGGSAGSAAAGNAGSANSGNTGGAGGAAVTGGGAGGTAGNAVSSGTNGRDYGNAGSVPGAGGGGGGELFPVRSGGAGGNGASGRVTLSWASPGSPSNVILRFLVDIPANSTPANGATLIRGAVAAGVLTKIECYYSTASSGKLSIRGYNGATLVFDSAGSGIIGVNGTQLMVSLEIANSGANVAWAIKTVKPGATTLFGSATGTYTTASVASMTTVTVAPNSDINDTAIGQIVVQYALEDMITSGLADDVNGHDGEMAARRFVRLGQEEGFTAGAIGTYSFTSTVQGWTAVSNCTIAQTNYSVPVSGSGSAWPVFGTGSLQITPSSNAAFYAESPTGLSGIPIAPLSVVSVSADASAESSSATILNPYIAIEWFDSLGNSVSVAPITTGPTIGQGTNVVLLGLGTAPANAVFFAIRAGGSGWSGSSNSMVIDNVAISPQMGPQLDYKLTDLLQEIEDADQGQLEEARDMYGLYYHTRASLQNQSVALTLNYTNSVLSGALVPITDDQFARNDVTLTRPNGSSANVSLNSGAMSTQPPPNGIGDYTYNAQVNLHSDYQLPTAAQQVLNVGTVDQYRYPQITVNLARAQVSGSGLFDATPAITVGGYVQITNAPSWVPENPIKQLAVGFSETINTFVWEITFNGIPEIVYEGTGLFW